MSDEQTPSPLAREETKSKSAEPSAEPARPESPPIPLLSARTWSLSFLAFGIALAITFSLTMTTFMANAH